MPPKAKSKPAEGTTRPTPKSKPDATEPKPVACYVRVSSKDQKHASQKAEISKWLRATGVELGSVAWYSDVESGKKMTRPGLDALKADIFAGKVKTVVVYRLDRLARRLREGLDTLSDWCERGVRVVSITQQIDMNGAVGRMIAAVMLGLAEIELEFRAERQAAGIAVAKKLPGKYKGRAKGTHKAGKDAPEEARRLQAAGNSTRQIARSMGISQRSVFRYLKAD